MKIFDDKLFGIGVFFLTNRLSLNFESVVEKVNSRGDQITERTACGVMVCQAASQTRFRALKHESGIAGSATIIVRVIACFQPLQDCQAEYFRHLLKPVT
ncbi:hypothetical protein LOK49_LG05G03074 [Camellia lanceoleosa]|uniref:Uncharacterized protein n=1 Tax=Camellia lanceoleosa TaxID=1840588 RepID=A0ACC0HMX1_9ERIC|nr:hypothetical protein LOK49_LG05G03074 [Camellia lanceoleosa]